MAEPFATAADVAARWRTLTTDEAATATVLNADASDIIRLRFPDVDSRINSGALTALSLRRIVAAMVKRAMINPDVEGVTQQSQGMGPFSVGQTFANPMGNLYLSADEVSLLNGFVRGRAVMGWLA